LPAREPRLENEVFAFDISEFGEALPYGVVARSGTAEE
jgi:hypothetical protein